MANQILRDCKLWVDKYDFSGKMNALALTVGVDLKSDTAFGHATKSNAAGIKNANFAHEGYFDTGAGNVEEVFFGNVGLSGKVMTVSPEAGAEGDSAYFFQTLQSSYASGGKHGDLLNFSIKGEAQHDLVKGRILHNAQRTVTGTTTPIQLGAVSTLQKLFAALHVLSASGTTPALVVRVQSASVQAFTTPNDRIVFASQNAANAVWATPVPGAITDTWWRISYTLSGTTPQFQFTVPVGIQ